jgi:acyl carrier protein
MLEPSLRPQLEGCFLSVFSNLDPATVHTASMASVAEWDSVAALTLVAVLEETFNIEIEPEVIEDFVSFEMVEDYLSKKLG